MVAALLVTLTACGGGGSDEASAIEGAAQDYSDAFLTGDAEGAYALLSERCQERTPSDAFALVVETAASQYGTALEFSDYDAEVNGEQARVTYSYADHSEIDQTDEPWVKESGEWRVDDC